MTDVNEFINEIFEKISNKISDLYNEQLIEHRRNISYNLSTGYTENYGKIETKYDQHIKKYDESRYAVHIMYLDVLPYDGNNASTECVVFDNYGSYYRIHCDYFGTIDKLQNISNKENYMLPDILIDLLKSVEYMKDTNLKCLTQDFEKFIDGIHHVSKMFYEKFTKYNSLYESGKLLDYDELLDKIDNNEIAYENKIRELEYELIKKNEIINVLTNEKKCYETVDINEIYELKNHIDILIRENKSLKTQIDENKNIIEKYDKINKLNSKYKELIDELYNNDK